MSAVDSAGHPRWPHRCLLALTAVVLVWASMLAGVSFLATPAKFLAPSLDLPVALEIGSHTFRVFQWVEFGFSLLVLLLALVARRPWIVLAVAAVLFALVELQMLWLLPALHSRTLMIIAGETPPPSQLHTLYGVVEAVKFLFLLATGLVLLWRRPTATV